MKRPEKAHPDHSYTKNIQTTVMIIVSVYVAVKLFFYFFLVEGHYWIPRLAAVPVTLLAVGFAGHRLQNNKRVSAVAIPLILTILESLLCAGFEGDRLYFIFLMGSTILSFLYVDAGGLLIYILLSNLVVVLFSFILDFPMLGTAYTQYDSIMQFLAFNIMNLIFYAICRVSVGRYDKFEKTSRMYDMIMETTPNFMVITNENTVITHISRALVEWLGLDDPKYALGRPLLDLFASGNMKMMFHEVMEDEGYVEKNFEITIGGRACWFMLRSSLTGTDRVSRFFEWVDITPIVESQKAAEAATRAKSDFLARMSHEIRTPMNAVMGMSELLLRKELPQDAYEHALMIKSASTNLLSIINDILDFSKIESGMMEIVEAEYPFPSLINDVINIIRMRIAEKPVQFAAYVDPDIPGRLCGDEIRLRQIMINLLSNAAKYTNEGHVLLTVTGERSGQVVTLSIEIADTGVGIKPEDIGRLFGNFVQFDALQNRGIEGTGLGLAISRNLCRLMGGDIDVRSEYGKGSVFTVTLPQKFDNDEPFASASEPAEKSVLLYEPRAVHRDAICRTLSKLSVPHRCAGSLPELSAHIGQYAFVFIASFAYDDARAVLEQAESPAAPVLLADSKEALAPKDVRILSLPAHALSIANILNNVQADGSEAQSSGVSFTAPEAQILIVDDVMANLKVAEGLLSPYEMQVTLCSGGAEALKLIAGHTYDLVFMDHMMPEMDGLEAARRIRAMQGAYFQELPIVALTANAVSGVREMFVRNGMNDFLAKPVETARLDAILGKWIPKEKRRWKPRGEQQAGESAFTELMKTMPGLSVGKALTVLGGSAEAYENILRLSVRLLPENITRLEGLIDTDWANYTIEIHGVKGVLHNMGAYELGRTAQKLEDLSRHKDYDTCRALHPPFIDELMRFYDALRELIGSIEAPAKKDGDLSQLRQALPELRKAAEFYDSALALDLLTSLDAHSFEGSTEEMLAKLTLAFERFDFDLAGEHLREWEGLLHK